MQTDLPALQASIQPILVQLETERQQILWKTLYYALGGGLLGALFRYFTLILLGVGVGILIANWLVIVPYRRKLKRQVIEQVVKFVSPNLYYEPETGVGEGAYVGSLLFPRHYDKLSQEDLITGSVGQTHVRVSELHSQYCRKDRKGHRQWHTIFRGLFYILNFPKSFRGTTIVTPDRTSWLDNSWLGHLGGMLQSVEAFLQGDDPRLELVTLEDPEFERLFKVRSTDQVEARYLLSTSMMERMVRLRERGEVSLSFVGNQFYVAMACDQNLFESPTNLFQPIDGRDLAEHLTNVHHVLAIVDELDLNTRIWQ